MRASAGHAVGFDEIMSATRSYQEHLDEVLRSPAEALAYLEAALAENDAEVFRIALLDVARAQGWWEEESS